MDIACPDYEIPYVNEANEKASHYSKHKRTDFYIM